MKKNLKNLWGKRIFSSFLSISFLLSGISPAFNVSAASPASVPDTLTLKESAGVCSGNSVAFNVRSNAFNSSKLKFYQDMLGGSHTKTNASTKSGAPNATSAEDWFDIAYILHRNRQSQSGTSNYSSRMEAMRYSTIAEYNNTGKISNNEYKSNYVWYIHRSGFNYSNSLSSANTDIRKKLYEYYLAQHTSSSNKKGWDWSDKSATHSFKSLENNTTQDVFWSILSLNRSEGDSNRRGHGSALIAVFYDFKVSPVLQEDSGTTYIRTRSDGSDKNESFVSSFTNDTPQSANAEYTGSTENTVSHTSNISGSSSYTMGHSVTVGTNVNFGAFASGSVDYTFDYSNTVEKGWSKEDSVSKTEKKEDKSSISLPAYSAIKMKRTTSDSEEVTTYNCPVILTYKVMLLEHVLNASNDQADAATATLGTFGSSSISAREDLKTYLTDNVNIKDTNRGVTWSSFASNADTKQAFRYALSNTAQYIPMSSAGATYSVNLKTINITYDGLISTRALSRIETADNINHKNLPAGTSINVSDIKLKGINAAGTDYIGFNQNRGHWILTDAAGHEDGKWCHVHIIVDITLPVYIRVYGQHYLQEGQGCEDPDPPVVFPGLGAGYPVADHGNADPLGEEGQQVGGHKGVGFQEHTHKKDGRETGQRPVRHCFKHILEKWHGHIDGEGHVDQPQKRAILLDGAGQDAVEGFSERVSTYRIQPSVLPHIKEKVND